MNLGFLFYLILFSFAEWLHSPMLSEAPEWFCAISRVTRVTYTFLKGLPLSLSVCSKVSQQGFTSGLMRLPMHSMVFRSQERTFCFKHVCPSWANMTSDIPLVHISSSELKYKYPRSSHTSCSYLFWSWQWLHYLDYLLVLKWNPSFLSGVNSGGLHEERPKTEFHSARWESSTSGQCKELGEGRREYSKQPGGTKKGHWTIKRGSSYRGEKGAWGRGISKCLKIPSFPSVSLSQGWPFRSGWQKAAMVATWKPPKHSSATTFHQTGNQLQIRATHRSVGGPYSVTWGASRGEKKEDKGKERKCPSPRACREFNLCPNPLLWLTD